MAKIEIDEEEYNRTVGLRNTLAKVMANPKAKLLVQQAHKMVDPTAVTPDLDRANEISEPLTKLQKEFDDYKASEAKAKSDQEAEAARKALTNSFEAGRAQLRREKWTDEGIKKLEEFMEQKGIIDHMIAVPAFERLHPPAVPATPSGGSGAWNFMEQPADADDDIKQLIATKGESDPLLRKMSNEALNEIRGIQTRR